MGLGLSPESKATRTAPLHGDWDEIKGVEKNLDLEEDCLGVPPRRCTVSLQEDTFTGVWLSWGNRARGAVFLGMCQSDVGVKMLRDTGLCATSAVLVQPLLW